MLCFIWSLLPKQQKQNNKPTNNNNNQQQEQAITTKQQSWDPEFKRTKNQRHTKKATTTPNPNEQKHYKNNWFSFCFGGCSFFGCYCCQNNKNKTTSQQKNKQTKQQTKQLQPTIDQATTTRQQPWDPKFKQIKKNNTKPKQHPKRKQARTTKLTLCSTDILTVSPYDLHAFLIFVFLCRFSTYFPVYYCSLSSSFFLLLAVLLSSSIFLSILAFLWSKPCKDSSTNKNTIKQVFFVFLSLLIAQPTKAKQQNNKQSCFFHFEAKQGIKNK